MCLILCCGFGYYLITMNNSRKKVEDMKYITRNLENVVNQVTKEYPVVCMKPGLSAIDRENYIVPIWMI